MQKAVNSKDHGLVLGAVVGFDSPSRLGNSIIYGYLKPYNCVKFISIRQEYMRS